MDNRKFMHGGIFSTRCVDGYKKKSNSDMVSDDWECTCNRPSDIGAKRNVDFGRIRNNCRHRLSVIVEVQPARNWVWRQLDNLKPRSFSRCVESTCVTYDCIYECIDTVRNRDVEKEIKKKKPCAFRSLFAGGVSRGMRLVRKECKASTIVEMAYLMPVILLMWMLVIFALFYYHDKTLAIGASYETAVVGGEWYEEADEVETERIGEYFQNRIRGKLLFFSYISVEVQLEDDWLLVDANARKRGMRIHAVQKVKIRNPQKEIRRIQIIKDGLEDLKD